MSDSRPRGYRSLFWPIILIGVGGVWLLGNLNLLPANSLYWLGNLWPLLLIGIGADLIFARRLPALGALIGVVLIAIVLLVLFLGPSLGLPQPSAPEYRTFVMPGGGITSATVKLDLSSYSTTISPLPASSTDLFKAEVYDRGNVTYSGKAENGVANITLGSS